MKMDLTGWDTTSMAMIGMGTIVVGLIKRASREMETI